MKHFFSLQWLRIKETGIVFTDELKRIFRDPGVLVIFIVATLVYPFLYKAIYWNEQIKDIPVAGTFEDLCKQVDVMLDSSPGGVGASNKEKYYEKLGVKAIFQGGEKNSVADVFFHKMITFIIVIAYALNREALTRRTACQ